MVRNIKWIGIGAVSALLVGVVIVGCSNQNGNPDNTPGAPASPVNSTTSAPQTNSPGNNMPGNNTPGNNMPGRGMGDNRGGTGNHPGMNGTPMSGGGMGGNR